MEGTRIRQLGHSPHDRRHRGRRQTEQGQPGVKNTPWGIWSATEKVKKDLSVTQGSLSTTMDVSRRHKMYIIMKARDHKEFARKAWMQCDKSSNAWVTACPKEHSELNARQFRRQGTGMSGGNGGTENTAEIRQGRKDLARDDLRRLRRKSGQGYFARG
jgi:hypothetical protein